MRTSLRVALISICVIALYGCQSQSPPPSMPSPPSTPSSSSQPPSMPSPPSTPSSSSQPPSMPSPPSTPSSSSQPPSMPSQPSSSQSESSSQQDNQSSDNESQQGQESTAGDPGEPGSDQQASSSDDEANQEAAADGLLTTGQNLIDAATAGSDADQSTTADQTTSDAGAQWDPLIPETENSNSAEELIFSDSQATSEQSSSQTSHPSSDQDLAQQPSNTDSVSDPSESKDANSAPGTEQETSATGQDSQTGEADSPSQQLAQTLVQAGQRLNQAGQALSDMPADGEVADIEQLLAEARIAVMVSEQALEAATGQDPTDADNSAMLRDARIFLGDANRALILATNVLLSGDLGLPEARANDSAAGNQRISELDKVLQDSIVVFQEGVLEARQVATRTQPPPTATAADGQQTIIINGSGVEETGSENADTEDPLMSPVQQGRMLDETAVVAANSALSIPDDIPSPQGDDIVAQQLREAAMAEKDPDLQAKLWQEYKRYKEGM